jgi:hypothetical protein
MRTSQKIKPTRRNKPSPEIEHALASPWSPKTTAEKYHNERSTAKKKEKVIFTTKQRQQTVNEGQNQKLNGFETAPFSKPDSICLNSVYA